MLPIWTHSAAWRWPSVPAETGGTMPCVLNAANEVAVDAFLHDACTFTDIDRIVESCMDAHDTQAVAFV